MIDLSVLFTLGNYTSKDENTVDEPGNCNKCSHFFPELEGHEYVGAWCTYKSSETGMMHDIHEREFVCPLQETAVKEVKQ